MSHGVTADQPGRWGRLAGSRVKIPQHPREIVQVDLLIIVPVGQLHHRLRHFRSGHARRAVVAAVAEQGAQGCLQVVAVDEARVFLVEHREGQHLIVVLILIRRGQVCD